MSTDTVTHAIESLYSRLLSASASHMDLCVHALVDPNHYQSFPTSTFGRFEGMLPHLHSQFAVQASNPGIEAVINEAPWPQTNVHLGIDLIVQIVDDATQLGSAYGYMPSAAFIRTERALVLWGDYEGAIVLCWEEMITHIQSRHGTAIANSVSYGLSGGVDLYNNLPPLDELSSLTTVLGPAPPSPAIAPEVYTGVSLYPQWPMVQSESPDLGDLQLAFRVPGLSTPSSDNSTSSFGDFSFNFDFSGSSLSPGYLVGGPSEGEDAASDVSVVSSSLSDRGASPVPSVSSEGTTSTTVEHLVPPPVTVFRRHSVGQTDAPLGRSDSEKTVTKRGMSEDVHVDGDAFNVDINENQQVVMSDVRGSKRIRPFAAVTATSAPALLTIPLPAVESAHYTATNDASLTHDDNNNQPTAPTSTPTSTSTSAAPSSSSSSAPAPAPRRTRRRGGGATRAKRTQCEYCSKSFSRVQDAQRHVATSCAASPDRTGIECPACDSVLSRLDAAQRHWRGKHENSTCEPPEWALHA